MNPRTLILRTAGVNCDRETAFAFQTAGAAPESLHINQLLENPDRLGDYAILALPGGFSYGDDIAAGRIFANQMRHHLGDALRTFVEAGKPIIGICNGFQVLVKTGLLPGPFDPRGGQTATLAHNDNGRFIARWVGLAPVSRKCIWTRGLDKRLELPIAHGEGKFVPADQGVLESLAANDQVALIYADDDGDPADGRAPANPNGSVGDIAGICDPTGLVFGLMPHPERYLTPLNHPAWTRQNPPPQTGAGLRIFQNAVEHARG